MSKKCRHCNFENDDNMYFCHACGEPLSKDLKLMMDLDKAIKDPRGGSDQPRRRKADDDDEYVYPRHTQQKEKSNNWLVVLLVLVIIGVLVWLFLR